MQLIEAAFVGGLYTQHVIIITMELWGCCLCSPNSVYYAINEIAGHEHVLESGGEVIILEFVEGFSTTATIKRISTDS